MLYRTEGEFIKISKEIFKQEAMSLDIREGTAIFKDLLKA
jgi:hypothetical protein